MVHNDAGTIMGVSRFLKDKNPDVQIVGLQPSEGASIAGIRRWPKQYLPKIFQVDVRWQMWLVCQRSSAFMSNAPFCNKGWLGLVLQEERVDEVVEIGQREAEETMRSLAKVEGIFAGAHPFWAKKGTQMSLRSSRL